MIDHISQSIVLAQGEPILGVLFMTVLVGGIGAALAYTGWMAIKTRTANARKLERLWANEDG